jgi:phosphate transport system permease protein
MEMSRAPSVERPPSAAEVTSVPLAAQTPTASPVVGSASRSDSAIPQGRPLARPLRSKRKGGRALSSLAELAIRILAFSSIAAVVLIFVFIGKEALPLLHSAEIAREVTLIKMWFAQQWPGYDAAEHIWQPVSEIPKYSVWPLVIGTLKVTLVSMLVAVPLGVAAALFVSQYASRRWREIIKPTVELLAGIPSVVLGFFALMVMATWFQDVFSLDSRLNAVVAGVALSFAIIPVVFTMSEEAFGAVPRSYIEASTALGAARWQTIVRVVVPAAGPGLAAGVALGFGRAIGETMIVLMASGNAAILSANPGDSVRTVSATIAAELAEVVFGGAHYTVLFFLGVLLFGFTFLTNLVGDFAITRMRRRLGGAR